MKIRDVKAHCDIPCAVYDPAVAQFAALSVARFLDLIGEMDDTLSSCLLYTSPSPRDS